MRMLWNFKITVTANNAVVLSGEANSAWTAYWHAKEALTNALSGFEQRVQNLAEGQRASVPVAITAITVECLLNRRAPKRPRRPPEVIAAEKKAKAERARQRAIANEAQKKAEEHQALLHRTRITHQIDYAFKSGAESGSEPVAKYITCQHCDAPAAVLQLNREVPHGAAVLDEITIVGAVCSEHNHNYWRGATQASIPCSQLEFFYSGIRQIGIKAVTK